jgi:anti-sigma factor RsiW
MTLTEERRRQVELLLPFWVNGSLTAAEATAVKAAVSSDSELRAQADALRTLRRKLQAHAPEDSPGDLGLARLQRAITAETAPRPARWRPSVAAAIAATLAGVGVYTLAPDRNVTGDFFTQASGDAGQVLAVSFRHDATEAQISGLLLARGLVIVDGPSALGLYRLAPVNEAELKLVAEALKAEAAVIESVELIE